jgi:hypothetical protein
MRRPSRRLVAVLLTLAVLTGFAGTLAVWVNRQALNTNNWTNTSSRLLADPQIRQALSNYLVDEVFASVGVSRSIGSALPTPAAGLAAPLTAGLRSIADRVVPAVLATDPAQRAWREANRAAHTQLMRIINGGGKAVSTRGGVVTLDLRPILEAAIARIGLLQRLGITVPAKAGAIVIMRSDQLKTAQNIAVGIRGLAVTFTIMPLALCALALWLAVGWRRIVLWRIGWCAVGLGIAVLLTRLLLGKIVIDALVTAPSARGAGNAAWLIGTSLLHGIAVAIIVSGLIIVVASWLAGRGAAGRRPTGRPAARRGSVASASGTPRR